MSKPSNETAERRATRIEHVDHDLFTVTFGYLPRGSRHFIGVGKTHYAEKKVAYAAAADWRADPSPLR